MKRTLIDDLRNEKGQEVQISGWVDVRRDHGKLVFLDLRDRSGRVQMVALPNHKEAHEIAGSLRPEWVISVTGKVNERPEKMVNKAEPNGDIEIEITKIEILSRAVELPFEKDTVINLDTYLDHLPLTLRPEYKKAIFKVQSVVISAFREYFTDQDFTEIQAPKIIGEDAEGGANSFEIEYFKHRAHLAQSPQFYKQIMVGIFERVFTSGNVYRAEKHSTSRHLNEYTSLDAEMGFIGDHTDVMNVLSGFFKHLVKRLKDDCQKEFSLLEVELPKLPEEIPSITFAEALELISKGDNRDVTKAQDLEPQDERWLCEYAKEKFGSDFIYVTHFPTAKRPMYTYRDTDNPEITKGFDLLFNGVEIVTGGQRIHDYDELVAAMKAKGLNPEKFSFYLQAFKYGMPPHGGFGMGLERVTAKILGLDNVKEATLFPREINRIDNLLSN